MPKLGDINPVVLAPDPNKQTDRQTQTDLYYIYVKYLVFFCFIIYQFPVAPPLDLPAADHLAQAVGVHAEGERVDHFLENEFKFL